MGGGRRMADPLWPNRNPPALAGCLDDSDDTSFPDLKPTHYTADGQACYDIGELAGSLGIDEEEARKIIEQKEAEHQLLQMFKDDDTDIVH